MAATTHEAASTQHRDDPAIRVVVAVLRLDDDLRERPEIAWQWLELAAAAAERAARTGQSGFTCAKRAGCACWLATGLPRVAHLTDLVRSDETSLTARAPDDF